MADSPSRVLLFGGSFNPPTLAHEAIMRACLALPGFDEMWVLPSGSWAGKTIDTDDECRLQMVRLVHCEVFASDPRLRVSDFELRLPRPTRTSRTLRTLHEAYPGTDFWFACGGDSYHTMPDWPEADEFMPGLGLVVFTDTPVPEGPRLLRLQLPADVQHDSSTEARALLARGADASHLVSRTVLDYCLAHQVYS